MATTRLRLAIRSSYVVAFVETPKSNALAAHLLHQSGIRVPRLVGQMTGQLAEPRSARHTCIKPARTLLCGNMSQPSTLGNPPLPASQKEGPRMGNRPGDCSTALQRQDHVTVGHNSRIRAEGCSHRPELIQDHPNHPVNGQTSLALT